MTDPNRIVISAEETGPLEAALRAAHPEVAVRTGRTYDDLERDLAGFRLDAVSTVRFAGTDGHPRATLFSPNGPRWISNGGAGTDHFGIWDLTRVTVTNSAGVAAGMMAEYVLGGSLHFKLDVPGLLREKAARRWAARTVAPLNGKTTLIVGLGHTGQALAVLRARAFGMTVLGTRARPRPMENVHEVQSADTLTGLLPRADFVPVATPRTDRTRGLIGATQIASMKPGVILAACRAAALWNRRRS